MKTVFIKIVMALVVLLSISSCAKEDPLTPNILAGPSSLQDSIILIPIPGGGGGTVGGGPEFFDFRVNGVLFQEVNPDYKLSPFGGSAILASHVSSLTNYLQFGFFIEPTIPEIRPLGFSPSASFTFDLTNPNTNYSVVIDGEMDITEVDDSKIAGTFFFRATPVTGGDTITVTDGRFSVNK